MRFGVVVLMLALVALIYYLVAMYAPSIGSNLGHIPIEGIQ